MSPMPVKILTPSLSQMMLAQYAGTQPELLCRLVKRCAPDLQVRPCIPVPLEQQCLFSTASRPGLQLAFINFGQATYISGYLPETLGMAIFERAVQVTLNDVSLQLRAFEPIFLSPGQHIELTLPRKARFYYLQLSPADPKTDISVLSRYAAAARTRNDEDIKDAFSQVVMNHLQQIKYCPTAAIRHRHLDRLRWQLVEMFNGLEKGKPVIPPREHPKDPRLQRISDFIEEKRQWDYQPEVLCEMAGMSLRNLYYGFERDFATTPFRFHRNCKLARVRYALLKDHAQTHPISWHATNEGFFHLSRFAGQYRQLFDELPSATVRRLQLVAGDSKIHCCGEAHRTLADCNPETCHLWSGCSLTSAIDEPA